jgi:hypothetical protein
VHLPHDHPTQSERNDGNKWHPGSLQDGPAD